MKRKDIRQKVQQKIEQKDQALLAAFVATFSTDTGHSDDEENPPPFAFATEVAQLKPLYAVLPGPFPPLYEMLVLSYRWPLVELPEIMVEKIKWSLVPLLLANPSGEGLGGLLAQICRDKGLWDELSPAGYIQFA